MSPHDRYSHSLRQPILTGYAISRHDEDLLEARLHHGKVGEVARLHGSLERVEYVCERRAVLRQLALEREHVRGAAAVGREPGVEV